MLGGDEDLLDADGLVVLIADRDLGLAVWAQVLESAVLAHGGEALGKAVRQVDGHGHEGGGLVAGKAEHHALVSGADDVQRVCAVLAILCGVVHALGDVGALLVDGVDHAAGVCVKAELGAGVADLSDHVAHDGVDVDVGLGADLSGDHHEAGGDHGLAGNAGVVRVGGHAVRGDVACLGKLDLLGEDGVDHSVRDLVADLVRMTLGNGLRGEEV